MINITSTLPNIFSTPSANNSSSSTTSTEGSDFDSTIAEFGKLAHESPWQRMFDSVLKEHGLTEDQFNKLPSKQQEAIRKEVEEALKQSMKTPSSTAAGSLTALLNSGTVTAHDARGHNGESTQRPFTDGE